MKKVVYIIPGFGQKTSQKGYQQVIKFFKSHKFNVVPVRISWKNRVMSDYVKEFFNQVKRDGNNQIYLFGFSYGAMIAFISSIKLKPKTQILCSLSPHFREDLKYFKRPWKKIIGKKRMSDLKNFSFNTLARKINCKTILLAGTEESKKYPLFEKRVKNANKKIHNSKLFMIQGAKHEISQNVYLEKIKEIISEV